MTWKRMVLEIGMGTDIRGADPTKAAVRALRDALWHNSLSIAAALGQDTDSMRVEVTIGVPRPDRVDTEAGPRPPRKEPGPHSRPAWRFRPGVAPGDRAAPRGRFGRSWLGACVD